MPADKTISLNPIVTKSPMFTYINGQQASRQIATPPGSCSVSCLHGVGAMPSCRVRSRVSCSDRSSCQVHRLRPRLMCAHHVCAASRAQRFARLISERLFVRYSTMVRRRNRRVMTGQVVSSRQGRSCLFGAPPTCAVLVKRAQVQTIATRAWRRSG